MIARVLALTFRCSCSFCVLTTTFFLCGCHNCMLISSRFLCTSRSKTKSFSLIQEDLTLVLIDEFWIKLKRSLFSSATFKSISKCIYTRNIWRFQVIFINTRHYYQWSTLFITYRRYWFQWLICFCNKTISLLCILSPLSSVVFNTCKCCFLNLILKNSIFCKIYFAKSIK